MYVSTKSKRQFCCRPCAYAYRRYHATHREEILIRKRAYDSANKVRKQAAKLKYRYGLSEQDIDLMYENQRGVCAIFDKPISRSGNQNQSICVDHDHGTGTVRGLLCRSCNTLLGYARDNAAVLRRAAKYLSQEWGEK